jgi:hypothetical protein
MFRAETSFRTEISQRAQQVFAPFLSCSSCMSLYDLFLAANDFREDHPQFAAALSTAQSRFHLSDSETAAILAESVAR